MHRTSSRAGLAALFAAILLVPAVPAQAQDETLLGDSPASVGGFGGPIFRVTQIAGETMVLNGGGGAAVFNRRLAFGGMGIKGTANVDAILEGVPQRGEMDFAYGGFTIEYITRPSKLVHATYGLLLGGGGISVWPDDSRPRNTKDSTTVFGLTEPQVGVQLNVTRWMRIGTTVGYRIAFGADVPKLANGQLHGPSATLLLRFGSF
ncbi:MAG: hypothetical protein KF689_10060 [Gemmatimonadaceae bacterium]|nr:hypothetical protein [Gemmatimonadaceae bacterium]MCW5826056.1 hypothetical protein [Gemmatimonadaceae bacterium]